MERWWWRASASPLSSFIFTWKVFLKRHWIICKIGWMTIDHVLQIFLTILSHICIFSLISPARLFTVVCFIGVGANKTVSLHLTIVWVNTFNWAKKKITAKHQRKLEEKVLTPISGCHNLPSTTPFSSSSTTTTSFSSTLTASPSPMATPDLAVTLWRAYPDTAVFDWLITLQVSPTASTKGYKHQKWK